MAATQNPNEMRLEELKAIKAKIAAEEARLKAEIAAEKAAEEDAIINAKADAQLIAQARGLEGDRDEDGTLIPIEAEQEVSKIDIADIFTANAGVKIDIADIKALDFEEPIILSTYVTTREELNALREAEKSNKGLDDRNEAKVQALADKYGIDKILLIRSPEWQSVYGDKYNDMFLAIPPIIKGATPVAAEEEVVEEEAGSKGLPKYQEPEKDTDGRKKATEIENLRGEKPGYKKGDSDYWSVNEKDDYWKTEEGYEEAVNLYGKKPSWLKAEDVGTLVYNPSTGEYEEVEQEEFEDLSRPAISADIKKLFG